MITQVKKPDGEPVTAARVTARGLFVRIGDFWPRVDGNERYLNEGAVVLLDTAESGGRFGEEYLARYDGGPKGSGAGATDLPGGTTDPVVLTLTERWLVDDPPIGSETQLLDVPTPEEAEAALPDLRAARIALAAKTA